MPNKGKGLPVTCNAGTDRSSGTAIIILNVGARWGVAVQSHASKSCPAERIAVPMVQETRFVPGAVGTGVENINSLSPYRGSNFGSSSMQELAVTSARSTMQKGT